MKFVVAFSSPKRSARTVNAAARHAKALGAEVVLVRVIPDPEKVGVVAQLISSDRPVDKAKQQIDLVVSELQAQGLNASGIVKVGEVAAGICKAAEELQADLLFVGTMSMKSPGLFFMQKDPIVHYLVDRCPVSLCLVRHDPSDPGEVLSAESADAEEEESEKADSKGE